MRIEEAEGHSDNNPVYEVVSGWDNLDGYVCFNGEEADRNDLVQDIEGKGFFDANDLTEMAGEIYEDLGAYNAVRREDGEEQIVNYRFRLHGANGHVLYERSAEQMYELEHGDTGDPVHDSLHPRLEDDKVWEDFIENGFEIKCE